MEHTKEKLKFVCMDGVIDPKYLREYDSREVEELLTQRNDLLITCKWLFDWAATKHQKYDNNDVCPRCSTCKNLKKAEQVYLELVGEFKNFVLVECTKDGELMSPEEIHTKVRDLIKL